MTSNDNNDSYSSNIHKFVAKQRELLDLELEAENEESLRIGNDRKGSHEDNERTRSHILGRLEASEVTVGLYGRTVVRLTLAQDGDLGGETSLLPAHRFTVGNEVEIRTKSSRKNLAGVISTVTEKYISVAIFEDKQGMAYKNETKKQKNNSKQKDENADTDSDESGVLDCPPLTLVPKSSVEVHKKLMAALERLERHGEDHPIAGAVIRTMFGDSVEPRVSTLRSRTKNYASFNPGLDASQKDAIAFALHPDRTVALIHGPPGTGKTTTVAELIRQAVYYHGMRVLVTAPSNVAVDNILERLAENSSGSSYKKLRTVRLGHPARIKPSILKHSLEALVQSSDATEIVKDVRKELESYLKILSKTASQTFKKSRNKEQTAKFYDKKRAAYKEVKALRKEVRQREEKVVEDLITSAQVVFATTVGSDNRVLNQITHPKADSSSYSTKNGFDLIVIDEAAQALEASCWIPILRGRKVVLAGDHCQLPPTIKSKDPRAMQGLGTTLFERLMKLYEHKEDQISRMLRIQYRMHHRIADWASQAMYHGELSTHQSVRDRTLRQLDSVMLQQEKGEDEEEESPVLLEHLKDTTLLLIDTAGCAMYEQETEAGSRFNEGEAILVTNHVRKLLRLGVEEDQVAIITPYNGQVEVLRNLLLGDFPRLEIRSVDGFQGGEKEAVVLSLVRSSDRGGIDGIGFLRDNRRQNVAVTRAKRHLAIVCDSETVSQSPFIQNLINWVGEHGEERSAMEFLSSSDRIDKDEYEADLKNAELELMNLVVEDPMISSKSTENLRNATSKPSVSNKGKKRASKEKIEHQKLSESERRRLMDEVKQFMETGEEGEEMHLSTELSSADRHLIHEFSENEGLGHRSVGIEGKDRRIVLTILKKACSKDSPDTNTSTAEEKQPPKDDSDTTAFRSDFSALSLEDSESEEFITDSGASGYQKNTDGARSRADVPQPNSLLAQLAMERATRQKQKESQNVQPKGSTGKNKKKKSKGQKLGGRKSQAVAKEVDIDLDGLDDMAFLDAQIQKSQNAHGRRVEGTGKGYRTIVNGILNSRPVPQSKPKNSQASAALRSKLNEAGSARKKKMKKKK